MLLLDCSRGVVDEVEVFLARESAEEAEQEWLREQSITATAGGEGKAQNGSELVLEQCEVVP